MKVVIGLDDSPYSEIVLKAVKERHWPEGTQFRIVSVVEKIPEEYRACLEQEEGKLAKQLEASAKEHATARCQKARHDIASAVQGSIVFFEIRDGKPAKELLDSAAEWGADRILVGAHGRTICPHNLPGSVSRKVAAGAPCHVEIVRDTKSHDRLLAHAV
jgi:nucleotide-binding universal stress UspA family protein